MILEGSEGPVESARRAKDLVTIVCLERFCELGSQILMLSVVKMKEAHHEYRRR